MRLFEMWVSCSAYHFAISFLLFFMAVDKLLKLSVYLSITERPLSAILHRSSVCLLYSTTSLFRSRNAPAAAPSPSVRSPSGPDIAVLSAAMIPSFVMTAPSIGIRDTAIVVPIAAIATVAVPFSTDISTGCLFSVFSPSMSFW